MDVAAAPFTDLGTVPCTLDGGVAHRAAIGLIVLATDQTMEHEFRHAIHLDGVGVYHARLFNSFDITPETLRAMQPLIAPATELILPGMELDVVAFGCTSASMTLGEDAVFTEIRRARPRVKCTTPVTAALAACRAFGARRIGVLTPYSAAVNRTVRAYLERSGLQVAAFATFDKQDDREAARISLPSIEDAIAALAEQAALDAVFVSCTSLRLCERVAAIEARAGLPVTSSDHALAWHCLRLAGVGDTVPGMGRLFELPLP
jgi:maleate isomerase